MTKIDKSKIKLGFLGFRILDFRFSDFGFSGFRIFRILRIITTTTTQIRNGKPRISVGFWSPFRCLSPTNTLFFKSVSVSRHINLFHHNSLSTDYLQNPVIMAFRSVHDEGSVDLHAVETIHEFPPNYFVENLAVRSNGGILVTVHNRKELIYIDPREAKPQPVVFHTFSASPSGIVEVEEDVFYVSVGTIGQRGSYAVFKVDVSDLKLNGDGDVTTPASVSKVVDLPDALFLNGSALLSREEVIILLADSVLGAVYSLQIPSGKVDVWLQHKVLEKINPKLPIPGANGIKVHNGYLYVSNTNGKTFLRAGITAAGACTGDVEVLQENLNVDDFAFDSKGSTYLATHGFQSVVKLDGDGSRSRIAGGPGDRTCAGTTAAAFGRTANDRTSLYVTSNGGMSNPVEGEVGPARLLRIEVDHAGA